MTAKAPDVEAPSTFTDWSDFVHTGPGTLAGRYLRMFWHPVCLAKDLPAGRAIPLRIMGEDLTLYRGERGSVHPLAFRCAHRGTQLSTGWVEGDDLRCFYHGWKYAPSGQCIDQPAEAEPFCQKVRIRAYHAHEYLGLIFAYLGEGEPPPPPRFPDFEGEGVRQVMTQGIMGCNYFNRLENATDDAHLIFVHPQMRLTGPPRIHAKETDYGIEVRTDYPDGYVNVDFFQMPNISQFPVTPQDPAETSPRIQMVWRVPIDDAHYAAYGLQLIHATGEAALRLAGPRELGGDHRIGDAVLKGERATVDLLKERNVFELQDYVAQVGQGAIADRAHERLGRSDVGVILLRKIWTRELRALAEGQPLKKWVRADRIEPTLEPLPGRKPNRSS